MIFSELKIQNGEIIGYSAKLAFELLLSKYDLVPDTEKTTLKSNFTRSGTPVWVISELGRLYEVCRDNYDIFLNSTKPSF